MLPGHQDRIHPLLRIGCLQLSRLPFGSQRQIFSTSTPQSQKSSTEHPSHLLTKVPQIMFSPTQPDPASNNSCSPLTLYRQSKFFLTPLKNSQRDSMKLLLWTNSLHFPSSCLFLRVGSLPLPLFLGFLFPITKTLDLKFSDVQLRIFFLNSLTLPLFLVYLSQRISNQLQTDRLRQVEYYLDR